MRGHRPCQICVHPARTSIEQAIVAGVIQQKIAEIFGVSRKPVGRHFRLHMSQAMRDEFAARKKAIKKKKLYDKKRRKTARNSLGKRSPAKWARESVAAMAEKAVVPAGSSNSPHKLAKITQLRANRNLSTTPDCGVNSILEEALVLKEVVVDVIAQAQEHNNAHGIIVGVREARELLKFCLSLCEAAAKMPIPVETIDVVNSDKWQHLEGIILAALEDEPEIRNKIAQRIIEETRKNASYSVVK